MYYEAIAAKYLDGHRIEISFADGQKGVVDFSKFIRKGGTFARLADPAVFKNFHINEDFGVLCWGDDLDIAPETLYDEAVGTTTHRRVAESGPTYTTGNKPKG